MARGIFISYRRDDAKADARNVHDRLAKAFGSANVFMDVDSLSVGQRFDQQLDSALQRCDVFLVIIGPRWGEILAARRLSTERDYVCDEIMTALQRGITIIPILVDGAKPPSGEVLGEQLRPLLLYQGQGVNHERFGRDIDFLISSIKSQRRAQRTEKLRNALRTYSTRRLRSVRIATILLFIFAALVYGGMRHSAALRGFAASIAGSAAPSPPSDSQATPAITLQPPPGPPEPERAATKSSPDDRATVDDAILRLPGNERFLALERALQEARVQLRQKVEIFNALEAKGDFRAADRAKNDLRDAQAEANDIAARMEKERIKLIDAENQRRQAALYAQNEALLQALGGRPSPKSDPPHGPIAKLIRKDADFHASPVDARSSDNIPEAITRRNLKRLKDLPSGWLALTQDDTAIIYDREGAELTSLSLQTYYERPSIPDGKSEREQKLFAVWQNRVNDVVAANDGLFFNVGCLPEGFKSNDRCGHVVSLNIITKKRNWLSGENISAGQLLLSGSILFTGGGFNNRNGVAVLDITTGAVLQRIDLDSALQELKLDGKKLSILSNKNTRYTFSVR